MHEVKQTVHALESTKFALLPHALPAFETKS